MELPHERFDRLLDSGQLMNAAGVNGLTKDDIARLADAILDRIPEKWDIRRPMSREVDWAICEASKRGYFGCGDVHGHRLAKRLIDSFEVEDEVPGTDRPSVRVTNVVAESGIGSTDLLLEIIKKVEGREHLVDRLLSHPAADLRVFRGVAASYATGDHVRVHNALLEIDEARRDPVVRGHILNSVGPRMRRMTILRRFIQDDMNDIEQHFREALRLRPATTLRWFEDDAEMQAVLTRDLLAPALEHRRREIRLRAIGLMSQLRDEGVPASGPRRGAASRP